jgi:hypothetical protein
VPVLTRRPTADAGRAARLAAVSQNLCCFTEVMIGSALMISDVTVNAIGGKSWANLPPKTLVIDGRHVGDENGRLRGQPLPKWTSSTARNRFSNAVIMAVLTAHPDALNGDT